MFSFGGIWKAVGSANFQSGSDNPKSNPDLLLNWVAKGKSWLSKLDFQMCTMGIIVVPADMVLSWHTIGIKVLTQNKNN